MAKRFGIHREALYRHRNKCLLPMLAKAMEAEKVAYAESILDRLDRLERRAWGILDRSEKQKDGMLSVSAVREIRSCLELCAKLAGQIQDNTVINVISMPQWVVLQQVLLSTLEAFPEARLAVADRLAHLGGGSSAYVHAETPNGHDA